MDILSDVNLVGNLKVSKELTVDDYVNARFLKTFIIRERNAGCGIFFSDAPIISNDIVFCNISKTNYYLGIHDGNIRAETVSVGRHTLSGAEVDWYYNDVLPEEFSIDVPAGCVRFFIKKFYISCSTNIDVSDDNNFIHPLVTAWCGGKKVDLDLELCTEQTYDQGITEFLIGVVTSSNSSRNLKISVY